MNRRELLKRLASVVPVAALVPVASAITLKTAEPQTMTGDIFHGWRLSWTGWKDMPGSDILVSQWMAYSPDIRGWHLYSSWPGRHGPCLMGSMFDLSIQSFQDYQGIPRRATPDKELAWMRNECLEILKRMIIKAGPPPFPIEAYRSGALKV